MYSALLHNVMKDNIHEIIRLYMNINKNIDTILTNMIFFLIGLVIFKINSFAVIIATYKKT